MYCTWIPFLKEINEELLAKLARKAGEAGFDILVLDDGWFTQNAWVLQRPLSRTRLATKQVPAH